MPKLEPKAVQKELEKGLISPVYWIYGPEKLKSREVLKRIRTAVLEESSGSSMFGWGEEVFEGDLIRAVDVVEAARSPSLGGGTRLIIVREAHALKDTEELAELLGPPQPRAELISVCVFLSKDLDSRKKFSKLLNEKAIVVPCEEVPEMQRETWIQFLAKRKGLTLSPRWVSNLSCMDPWSLDGVEQELEKISVSGLDEDSNDSSAEVSLAAVSDAFLDALLKKDRKTALSLVSRFADQPSISLPLLGLLTWNVKQLALTLSDSQISRTTKLHPMTAERLKQWLSHWTWSEIIDLQHELASLDFSLKQTPLLPLGAWIHLVIHTCG